MKKLSSFTSGFISCLLVTLLVSCSDKDNDPKVDLNLPVSSTTRDVYYNKIIDSTRHSYNKSGRMISISRSGEWATEIPTTIVYDNKARVSKIMDFKRVVEEREYTVNGLLYKIYQYDDLFNPTYKTVEKTFGYDDEGKLIKMNSIYSNKSLGSTNFHTLSKFTYNAEGLIALDSTFFITPGMLPGLAQITEYTYDNKKGVNEFGLIEPRIERYLYAFAPLKHNITSIKKTESSGSQVNITFQYVYNENDYPVRIDAYLRGNLSSSKRISYKPI